MYLHSFTFTQRHVFKMIYMPNIGSNKCYAKGLKDEKLYIDI